jgi:hypothetical protein
VFVDYYLFSIADFVLQENAGGWLRAEEQPTGFPYKAWQPDVGGFLSGSCWSWDVTLWFLFCR